MALVKGINCGFVTSAPAGDPGEGVVAYNTYAWALKDTAPAGAKRVTQIGWWCDNATEEANFEVGIYEHNVGDNNPEAPVHLEQTNAKGTSSGWKRVTGLNIAITGGVIYWPGVQLDDTATETNGNRVDAGGAKTDIKAGQTTLPNPWGASGTSYEHLHAIYAVYETDEEGKKPDFGCIRRELSTGSDVPGIYP